ncbi:MAG: flagellar assembly protein FliW [Armatimonadetes bacterium]|nr:flagellar assembly protein FliW [Armatimonadota bacterium]
MPTMQIETTRFGTIEVSEQSILHMADGMIGFEDYKRYVILEEKPDTPFKWLQAVDNPALAFVVINPMDFVADYEIDLDQEQTEALDLRDPCEAGVLTTVTISKDNGLVTTNLLGPIVINSRTLQGRQIVLQSEKYGIKHMIGLWLPQASTSESQQAA